MNYIDGSTLAGKQFKQLENGDLREVKRRKFIPEHGDRYWFIGTNGVIDTYMLRGDDIDRWIMKYNKVFATKEECEKYRNFIDTLDKYTFEPDWNNRDQDKWCLYYDHYDNKIHTGRCSYVQYAFSYFASEEKAEAFIAEVGGDAVKCFMFDVWE